MQEEQIIWKKIPNYELYEASSNGDIKTFNWKGLGREVIMKPAKDGQGYLRTMLKRNDGKIHTIKVHRIIAQTFLDNHENKKEVNHKNGIKDDNRVCNLEWNTRQENMNHAVSNLNMNVRRGEKNGCATISDKLAQEILDNYEFGDSRTKNITKAQLAVKYNTTLSVISNLVLRTTFRHLTPNNPTYDPSRYEKETAKERYRRKQKQSKINLEDPFGENFTEPPF